MDRLLPFQDSYFNPVFSLVLSSVLKSFSFASGTEQTYYPETENYKDLSKLEKTTLSFWEENKIFRQSVDQRSKNNMFVFYDGPPFANGLPHYGHLLTGYIKDTYGRYQTMRGRRVERRFGWDCHGLPAELQTEKELNISGKTQIEKFGVAKFNKRCRDEVLKYVSAWESYVHRQGRWVDFENGYQTMTNSYIESVMWAFKSLYSKGLVYESVRVLPYSWACQSPLSNFETRLDNAYRMKTSKAVTLGFELLRKPKCLENLEPPCVMLVWTTTPWTLPSNLALAVGKNITYTAVWRQPAYGQKSPHLIYIFAQNYLKRFTEIADKSGMYFQNLGMELSYEDLVGIEYKPLFSYFEKTPNAFRVLLGEHVSAEEGTGIVHTAPGFGQEDFDLCKKHDIPPICPVDSEGRFTQEVSEFNGTHVFDTDVEIIRHLKNISSWFFTEAYKHSYPHCWRTDTPLIYRTMPSWFVAVTKIKDRMIRLNKKVNWIPQHVKDGIFGNWLEAAQDWSISRNRFWGTPIPVWKSDNPMFPRVDVYGSIAELERDFGRKIKDLHRPFIDNLTRPNPDDPTGKSSMRRVPDILDCWFDSGSMPFAQHHYPFENEDFFEKHHPADFVTEYIAQTRGWFYTLFVLSTALFDREPFKNCICHGVVLDARGQKLSKRLNNYVDPAVLFVEHGSDAFRFLMLSRPVVIGDNLLLDKRGKAVEEVVRVVLKPIWNSYHFFTLYANTDHLKANISLDLAHYNSTIDKYILLKCFQAVEEIAKHMDNYQSQDACRVVTDFIDVLNNWYIRRSRDRFWKSEKDKDKYDAYNALYTVFNLILRASSPLLPFLTDAIWQNLNYKEASIHLAAFPTIQKHPDDITLKMDTVRGICNSALALRKLKGVRVRQPLKNLKMYHGSLNRALDEEYITIIKEETNVKNITFEDNFSDLAELQLQLHFPIVGKRIPDMMKTVIKLIGEGKWKRAPNNQVLVGDDAESYLIFENEYEMKLKPKSNDTCLFDNGKGIVMLDLTLDDDLILEGHARDVVRQVQETRKQAGLDISDRIRLILKTKNPIVKEAIEKWSDYIKEQTLSFSMDVVKTIEDDMFNVDFENVIVALRSYNEVR